MKLILLLIPFFLWASPTFTTSQIVTCKEAFNYGKKHNLGRTLAGIAYVESKCGLYKVGNGDFGVTQINVSNHLREIGESNTPMSRSRYATLLVTNDKLAYRLAVAELEYWKLKRGRTNWWHYVSSYNQGNIIQSNVYAEKVAEAIKLLLKHNIIN